MMSAGCTTCSCLSKCPNKDKPSTHLIIHLILLYYEMEACLQIYMEITIFLVLIDEYDYLYLTC